MSNDPKKKYDFGDELDDASPESWTPHPASNDTKPNVDEVKRVAEESGFVSREPKAAPEKEPEGQVNIRAPQSVVDDFRSFGATQEPKWPNGYVLKRAMEALKRELGEQT